MALNVLKTDIPPHSGPATRTLVGSASAHANSTHALILHSIVVSVSTLSVLAHQNPQPSQAR